MRAQAPQEMLLWISEVESAAVGHFRVEMRRLYQVLWGDRKSVV